MQFFEGMIQSETPLVLVLADGTEVRGVVREVDRDQLTVDGPSGQVVIRKSEIRYVSEDSE
jgi:small nuclear ribonucleoprotein (snRNP)-like protein